MADLLSRWIHFWFPAEIQGLWTKVPFMLCSLTWAYLLSLTLTCHVDVTLQPCVKSRESTKSLVSFGVMLMLLWLNVLADNVKHFNLVDNPNPRTLALLLRSRWIDGTRLWRDVLDRWIRLFMIVLLAACCWKKDVSSPLIMIPPL